MADAVTLPNPSQVTGRIHSLPTLAFWGGGLVPGNGEVAHKVKILDPVKLRSGLVVDLLQNLDLRPGGQAHALLIPRDHAHVNPWLLLLHAGGYLPLGHAQLQPPLLQSVFHIHTP